MVRVKPCGNRRCGCRAAMCLQAREHGLVAAGQGDELEIEIQPQQPFGGLVQRAYASAAAHQQHDGPVRIEARRGGAGLPVCHLRKRWHDRNAADVDAFRRQAACAHARGDLVAGGEIACQPRYHPQRMQVEVGDLHVHRTGQSRQRLFTREQFGRQEMRANDDIRREVGDGAAQAACVEPLDRATQARRHGVRRGFVGDAVQLCP